MSSLPQKCVQTKNEPVVSVSAKGKTFRINNKDHLNIKLVEIDHCVIVGSNGQKACDYGMLVKQIAKGYLIELKGKNIRRACQQLLSTIVFFKKNNFAELRGFAFIAVIVSSKYSVPKLKQSPEYVSLRKKTKDVLIKNNLLVVDL